MTPTRFKAWRDRMRYTQLEAARALGISTRQITRYETGEEPVPGEPWHTREVEIPLAVALACAALEARLKPI